MKGSANHNFITARATQAYSRIAFRGRRGLTLIELLATTALAGLLMATLLQVVAATGRTRALIEDNPLQAHTWLDQLAEQLNHDIAAAESARWKNDRLILEGWCGWDRKRLERSHEPAIVTYRLVGGGTSQILIREQRDVLDLGQQRPSQSVMAIGVDAWNMSGTSGHQDGPPNTHTSGGGQPLSLSFAGGEELEIALPAGLFDPKGGDR